MNIFKKFISVCIFSIFLFSANSAEKGAQELVPAGHWIYDCVTSLSLEAGIVNFAHNAPLSIQQIKLYLSEIDYDELSDAGKIEYDRIFEYFAETNFSIGSDILTIGLSPALNFEGFYKTNDDIDWTWNRYSRGHFIDMPATINCGDYFTMSMDVFLGQNKGMSLRNYNFSNVPYAPDQVDVNFPDDGYLSTGKMLTEKTGIAFQLGKGERNIGRTSMGSVIWSPYLTGTSFAQFEAFSTDFRYAGGITQFNTDRYFYYHQIEARLFKKLQITFLEGLFVYHSMELRYLNPWMIFHGFAPWREYDEKNEDTEDHTCDYFAINAQFTPVKNLRFYGLFAMTQYQTPFERDNWPDDVTPNGIGFQGGAEGFVPLGEGKLRFCLEGYWADPYLYIKESPNWSLVRTYSDNIGDHAIFYEWIGSPYGPDTISGELTAGYEVSGRWSLDFKYLFMARGEYSDSSIFERIGWGGQKTDFAYEDGDTENKENIKEWIYPDKGAQGDDEAKRRQSLSSPSGTAEYVNRISLKGTYNHSKQVKFTIQPSFVAVFNKNHQSGETAFGFEIAAATQIRFVK